MPIYLKWGNSLSPEIKGEVTESDFRGWIELSSAQLGGRRTAPAPSAKSGQSSSSPAIREIMVTKAFDSSSASLARESVQGRGTKVLIDFVKGTGPTADIYLELCLTETMISGYNISSGGDRPTESFTLNFTKLEWGNTQGMTPHASMPPLSLPYDLSSGQP